MSKRNGFFMIDLLITLSTLILLSSTLLPILIQLIEQSNNEKEKYTATVLLYEKLHEILVENKPPLNQIIIKNDKLYEFIARPELKEVCIQFEDNVQNKRQVCELLE